MTCVLYEVYINVSPNNRKECTPKGRYVYFYSEPRIPETFLGVHCTLLLSNHHCIAYFGGSIMWMSLQYFAWPSMARWIDWIVTELVRGDIHKIHFWLTEWLKTRLIMVSKWRLERSSEMRSGLNAKVWSISKIDNASVWVIWGAGFSD